MSEIDKLIKELSEATPSGDADTNTKNKYLLLDALKFRHYSVLERERFEFDKTQGKASA